MNGIDDVYYSSKGGIKLKNYLRMLLHFQKYLTYKIKITLFITFLPFQLRIKHL